MVRAVVRSMRYCREGDRNLLELEIARERGVGG
jgi:hypothetical protein